MRHRVKDNHLSRTASHRAAMLSNMAASLLLHKCIHTTLAKAKVLRKYVEPLITKSKFDTTHSRRTVFSYLQNKYAVKELFTEIAPRIAERPGGYTRILKLGPRQGDRAEMALIELVDYNEYLGTDGMRKSRRRARSKAKAGPTAAQPAATTPVTPGIEAQAAAAIGAHEGIALPVETHVIAEPEIAPEVVETEMAAAAEMVEAEAAPEVEAGHEEPEAKPDDEEKSE